MINGKIHQGLLCVQAARPGLIGDITRRLRGKWKKEWNCVTADATSFNCARLIELSHQFGWIGTDPYAVARIERRGWPVIIKEPSLFKEIKDGIPGPDYIEKLGAEALVRTEEEFLKRPLWKYQRTAFYELHNLTGPILDMGMGTGKTTTAIALMASKKHEFGMIVCPKSVIDVWPLEFGKNYKKEIEIYTGTGKKSQSIAQYVVGMEKQIRVAQAYKRPFVFVCNYEAMWQGALAEFIAANRFDYIIFDEVHRIKAPTGTASKFAAKLRHKADRIIGCTGTLLPHSPLDAFGSFRTIDPAVFGSNYIPFRNMFAEMGGFEGKQVKGYKNKEVMHKLISSVSFRITTEEALPHLPTKNHIVRKFKLDPKTERLYNEMASELYAEIENCQITAANAMVKGLRLMQITSGVVKDTDGVMHRVSREKADLFEDIITDIGIKEPLVVFCNFTADIEVVREVAEMTGRTVSELSGHKNELAQWQAGESDVLVVQIKAGKEGVDFTRACICMYYSIGHSLGDYEQSLFRVRRPGQERNVIYYHLVASGTIDEDVYDGLDKKRDIVLSILEGVTRRTATKKKKSIDKDAVDDVILRMQEQITQGVPHG